MALIGRQRELAAVARLLDRAAAGDSGRLVVTGPPGSGKSALIDAAVDLARERKIPVFRATAPTVSWLRSPDRLAQATDGPRLLLIDDIDDVDTFAVDLPASLDRLVSGATILVATAVEPTGLKPEMRLRGLTEPELAELSPGLSADAVHAVWLASGGLPGAALGLADELARLDVTCDPVLHLALAAPSRTEFLDLDPGLIRLLEAAAERTPAPEARARVLARLARELLGDPSAGQRRRTLIDEAVTLAREVGTPGVIAEVLDSGLHALWDPAAARERLATASEIVTQARRAGDAAAERRGLFWRFIALAELGELEAAESALTAYARAGSLAGDSEAAVVVLARQAMLATIRGRFDTAATLAAEVGVLGGRAGLADTERLVGTLRAALAMTRGEYGSLTAPWHDMARRLPGHFFEAAAARALAESGRGDEASLELERLLPAVLAGSGPRWLGVCADLAIVAALVGEPAQAQALYDALARYHGRLVVSGGANMISGPVDDYLGRLAMRLGRLDLAITHLDVAVTLERRLGALPWLAGTLAARARALTARDGAGDPLRAEEDLDQARSIAQRLGMGAFLATLTPPANEWSLRRDGEDWRLDAGTEAARLRDGRGMEYLRILLAAPRREIAALDLVAGGAGLAVPQGAPILDAVARAAYRRRLEALAEDLDAADRAGDAERARVVQEERTALLAELRKATGLGGRARGQSGEAERARVNATRALWAAVKRVEAAAPLAGAHLRASLRTGHLFRYQPAPGGPARWLL
ncbi:ATP-binding protein [Streptosporangium sp. NPDC023963]|uniref:ATP-binding protein n=1 Tax=Streptosporangium sp. NPDC023963 TaxID=3155608 RepID=UPI003422F39A